jgi:hypothetical protein
LLPTATPLGSQCRVQKSLDLSVLSFTHHISQKEESYFFLVSDFKPKTGKIVGGKRAFKLTKLNSDRGFSIDHLCNFPNALPLSVKWTQYYSLEPQNVSANDKPQDYNGL